MSATKSSSPGPNRRASALRALGPLPGLASRDLGEIALRGRNKPIHAYGIERFEAAAC